MSVEIITKEDLRMFRIQLLDELRQMIRQPEKKEEKEWLRSKEVQKLLGISAGTLQNYRINGTLPYKKVGGILYYKKSDISYVMDEESRTL